MKVNAGKSKVMVLNGEETLECEVHVDGIRLEQIFGVCFGRIRYRWSSVVGATSSLVNARDFC